MSIIELHKPYTMREKDALGLSEYYKIPVDAVLIPRNERMGFVCCDVLFWENDDIVTQRNIKFYPHTIKPAELDKDDQKIFGLWFYGV
jgi:hypothetical protein